MPHARMHPDEALALARLRTWIHDRIQLRSGRTTDYQKQGWQERKATRFDARIVRAIDFERALAKLDAEEHAALILTYRDHEDQPTIARGIGCSVRKLSYLIPRARKRLAEELDRMNLL